MEIEQVLGNDLMKEIVSKAKDRTIEFASQNPGTQLYYSVSNKQKLEIYEEATPHLINIIDDAGDEIKELQTDLKITKDENNEYKLKYDYVNPEYEKRRRENQVKVVKPRDYSSAKELCAKYVQKRINQHKN